jgi:4-carboxymuconolactone decarboxylase
MSRLPDPTPHLQGKDLDLYNALCAKRGRIDGMYRTLLNYPQLTEKVSDLGTYLRFESILPGDIREFIILYTAHQLQVGYEWEKHQAPAHQVGLSQEIITAVQNHASLPEPYNRLSQAVECALNLENIPNELQDEIIQLIGVKGILELVVLVGFYRMIGGIIRAFDVPLPPSE